MKTRLEKAMARPCVAHRSPIGTWCFPDLKMHCPERLGVRAAEPRERFINLDLTEES